MGVLILFLWIIFSTGSTYFLFLISLDLIIEIFFRFKVSKARPSVLVKENNGEKIINSFTLAAAGIYISSSDTKDLVKNILKSESAQFILEKADILNHKEVTVTDIPKEEIAKNAFEIAKTLNGSCVTVADMLVSYLLLIEGKTKLLFSKDLKKDELLKILIWARTRYSQEENPKPFRVEFLGEGIGESWVSGWTIESQKYMIDMTSEVLRKKSAIIGRQDEFMQLIEGMYKGKSALLVGETGSGRKEIAEFLAYESFAGSLKGNLYHQRFYLLLIDALLAGVNNQGDLEERLENLIAEVAHAGNIIIFIPSFENILGASSFNLDLSGILTPYMDRGAVRIIGTITPGAYKKFVEKRKSFVDNLEVIKVEEPDEIKVLQMLFKVSDELETPQTQVSYKAITAALKYANKYLPDRVLPGAAVALLSDTIQAARILGKKVVEEKDIIAKTEEKTHISIGKPGPIEKKLLLSLEKQIHQRVIGQNEAVASISEALRRIRTGLTETTRPVSFLFLGPTGVGKTETAKALARLYFKGEEKMIRLDMSEYSGGDSLKRLLGSAPGEDETSGEFTDKIYEDPFSLVLLDEFEKANPEVLNLFLQILEDGRLTDNKGRTVSFVDSIIIATSNAGSELIREEVEKGTNIDKKFQQNLLEFLQKKAIFRPELLNRFDGIVVFKPLEENEIKEVTKIILTEVKNKMKEQEIDVNFDEKVIYKIVSEGSDRELGARPIRRYIQDNIEDLIAQKILRDEIKKGDKLSLTVSNSQVTVNKSS